MPIKKLTLGLGLLAAGAVHAQAETYRIKDGDTISGIAARFHVKTSDILRANGLTAKSRLKLGRAITIPNRSVQADRGSSRSVPSGAGVYVVRNGDHDWNVAQRFGVTPTQLRALNPGLNWRSLQIGQKIRVPGGRSSSVATRSTAKTGKVSSGRTNAYRIQEGENDWTLARKFGVSAAALRSANPGLKWSRLQIGQTVRIPSSAASRVASKSAPASAKIRSRFAVVARDQATIRRSPKLSGDAITTVPAGTRVVVLDRDGDWYRLRFPKGTEGWMRGDLIKATSAPKSEVAARRQARLAKATKRTKKSTPRAAVATRSSSKRSSSTGHTNTATYAMTASGGSSQQKILSRAREFTGVRYRFGSMSRSATDCSGFTSQVFRSTGYKIPRTSAEQSRAGAPVSKGNLQEGDLVFFRTRRGSRVSHVGIYMGKGKFIHASSGGGKVQVNSLSDGYYKQRYVTARRVVKPSKSNASKAKAKAEVFPDAVPPID